MNEEKEILSVFLSRRKLTFKTARTFKLWYATRGRWAGRVMFPINDHDGNKVAWVGRAVDNDVEPKYLFEAGFQKNKCLFNLDGARFKSDFSWFILVEGFFDVMWLHQIGWDNAIACMGSSISLEQAKLLRFVHSDPCVIVLLDGDSAGKGGTITSLRNLNNAFVKSKPAYLPKDEQPDGQSKEVLEKLLNPDFDNIRIHYGEFDYMGNANSILEEEGLG